MKSPAKKLSIKTQKSFTFKGTVSIILSEPQSINGNARFTTVPLQFNNVEDIVVFLGLKVFMSVHSCFPAG